MKLLSRQTRQSFHLSDFEHHLSMYALAATAAGVGALALAPPMEGKVIYTKAHKSIGPGTTLHLDVNHDGIADFDLRDTFSTSTAGGEFGFLSALPDRQQNAVWGHTVPTRGYASALSAKVWIGPKGQFLPGTGFMANYSVSGGRHGGVRRPGNFSCTGPWANVTNRYLGLQFVINGTKHFGWARLNVSCSGPSINATLTGYAYETVPNRAILTGKKSGQDDTDNSMSGAAPLSSLGRLAMGAKGRPGE